MQGQMIGWVDNEQMGGSGYAGEQADQLTDGCAAEEQMNRKMV